jgi:hypothetical protein
MQPPLRLNFPPSMAYKNSKKNHNREELGMRNFLEEAAERVVIGLLGMVAATLVGGAWVIMMFLHLVAGG